MNSPSPRSVVLGTTRILVAALAAACLWQSAAVAQGRGPSLPPDKLNAAWTLEAQGVARDLGLSADETSKLVDAYKDVRASHQAALTELMQTAERGPGMFEQMQEINDTQRANLEKQVSGFLSKEQTDAAVKSLGTFNRQWDQYVDALSGLGLEKDKQYQALTLIAQYAVDSNAARDEAMAAMDFQGMRSSMQALKEKLDASMADILTADQLAQWKEATAMRGGRGGGGPGGRGPRG